MGQFNFRDETVTAGTEAERKSEENKAEIVGNYVYYCTLEEFEEMKNKKGARDELFRNLMCERLRHWVAFGEEKLKGKVDALIMMPGNDDEPYVDDVLAESKWILNPDRKVIKLLGNEVLSLGLANMTPWKCPRYPWSEMTDDLNRTKVQSLSQLRKMSLQLSELIFCANVNTCVSFGLNGFAWKRCVSLFSEPTGKVLIKTRD